MTDKPKTESEAWARVTSQFGEHALTLDRRSARRLRHRPQELSILLGRYKFLGRLATRGKRVLEVGVAESLGSRLLGEFAASYVGVDADVDFVAQANANFAPLKLRFQTTPVAAEKSHDLIVCLELDRALAATGEKASAGNIASFVAGLCSRLADDGILAVGVHRGDAGGSAAELRAAMVARFEQVLTFRGCGEAVLVDRDEDVDDGLIVGVLPKRSAESTTVATPTAGASRPQAVVDTPGDDLKFGSHVCFWLRNSPRRLLHSMSYYRFGSELIGPNRRVLDVGCGEGLGTWLMAQRNGYAAGVDLDQDVIKTALENFSDPRVRFTCEDFFEAATASFDAVVNFDCIEHILPQNVDQFWRRVTEYLTPGGMAVIGTPSITSDAYANPATRAGHVNLYSGDRLEEEMSRYFRAVFLFCANDEMIHTGFRPMAHYYLAVGVGKKG